MRKAAAHLSANISLVGTRGLGYYLLAVDRIQPAAKSISTPVCMHATAEIRTRGSSSRICRRRRIHSWILKRIVRRASFGHQRNLKYTVEGGFTYTPSQRVRGLNVEIQ